jgi:hypothetical protein
MGLYYMGVLLMIVGFIICFNAVFRMPSGARSDSAAITTATSIAADLDKVQRGALISRRGKG